MSFFNRPLALTGLFLVGSMASLGASTLATCTAGAVTVTNPSMCSIPDPNQVGGILVQASASASASGGLTGNVEVLTNAEFVPSEVGSLAVSGTAFADGTTTFYSNGPLQLGTITLNVGGLNESNDTPSIEVSDGTHVYHFSCAEGALGCHEVETVPFYLGTDFVVQEVANANTAQAPTVGIDAGDSTVDLSVTFSLSNSNDAGVPAFIVTPEPGTVIPVGLALVFGLLVIRQRRF